MNDELRELEFELSRLRPRGPSEFLEARVEAALENRRSTGFVLLRGLAAAGFAAGVAALVAFAPKLAIGGVGEALRPVAAHEVLQSAEEEGLTTLDDGTPGQRVRLHFMETVRWAGGGRVLTWTAPREELRIVPVNTY